MRPLKWWENQSVDSKIFGAIIGFRLGVSLFVGLTWWGSSASYRPWPMVGFLFLYTMTLLVVWRFRPAPATLHALQVVAFALDILAAILVLIQFSPTWQTGAPALLPVIAFEGWGYWGPMGALSGWLVSLVMLIGARFYQVVTHGQSFPLALMAFWTVTISLIIALPVVVSWLRIEVTALPAESLPLMDLLTPREQEIYGLLRQNYTALQIAAQCHIEPGTVKSHIHSIYRKLGIQRRSDITSRRSGESGA